MFYKLSAVKLELIDRTRYYKLMFDSRVM